MPVISTFGSLSIDGFTSQNNTRPSVGWLSAQSVYSNTSYFAGQIYSSNNKLWIVGTGGIGNPESANRPATININTIDGTMSKYFVFPDESYNNIYGTVEDSSGNIHIFYYDVVVGKTYLVKYNSTQTFIQAVTGIPGNFLAIDSSDNLYILNTSGGSSVSLYKIDPTTYNITWQYIYTVVSGYYGYYSLTIDNANNILVTSGDTTTGTTVIKINSSGTVVWSKTLSGYQTSGLTRKITVDSSNNVIASVPQASGGDILVKLDSSTGSLLNSYQIGSSLSPFALSINTDNNIVLLFFNTYFEGLSTQIIDPSTFTVLYSSELLLSSVTNSLKFERLTGGLGNLVSINGYLYIDVLFNGTSTKSYTCNILIKVNNNNNSYGASCTFGFTIVDNTGGISEVYAGTLTNSTYTAITLTSATYTLSTPTVNVTSSYVTTTSITSPTLGSTVPFNYAIALT